MSTDRSDATTGPVVPEQRGVRDPARAEVLHRHARLTRDGASGLLRAQPRRDRGPRAAAPGPRFRRQGDLLDARGGRGRGPRAGGARGPPAASLHLRALPAGHFHLTTDSTPRTGHLPLHLRIPQQRLPLSA